MPPSQAVKVPHCRSEQGFFGLGFLLFRLVVSHRHRDAGVHTGLYSSASWDAM